MFYVDLEPKENIKEIYKLQYLNNMKINVEPPNKKKNTILQCTRCQLYSHSKSYCTWLHLCEMRKKPYDNRMPTTEKKTPPKFALCSGEHTANYKDCTVYKDLQNARSKQTIRNQRTSGRRTTPPHTTNPPDLQQEMRTSITYSQVLQSKNMTH